MRTATTALLVLTMLLAGCAPATDGPPTDAAAPTASEAVMSDEAEASPSPDPGMSDEVAAVAADVVEAAAAGTTAATLEQMRSMSPERRAAAHGSHGDHSDHTAELDHPNGVLPERLVIPAIGVDADVIALGLEENGEMEVPTDFAQTGWFRPGPPPGRVGPAVIAGHVDSTTGPAVFHRLDELAPGDRIEVHGEAGEVVVFAVRETERHAKDAFPTDKVYGGTSGPELRLITCGGEFDSAERSYRDNVIVYAERIDG